MRKDTAGVSGLGATSEFEPGLPASRPAMMRVGSPLLPLKQRRERLCLSLLQIVALFLRNPENCAALGVTATELSSDTLPTDYFFSFRP
jgi:hypothetical protein